MRQILAILIMLAAVTPVVAQEQPSMRPNRDVEVEYRSSGLPQGPVDDPGRSVTMRFSSKSSRIRIDGAEGRGYAILDIGTGRMIIVMAERKMYIDRPADPGMVSMFQATNTAFRKTGTDNVAGVPCTTYDATISERTGQVCLTGDGVMLRAKSSQPDRNRVLEAVKVTYTEQPASLFETPPGYQKLDIPDMPRGTNMPPPGGQIGR